VLDVAQPSGSASPPSQDANGSACLQSGGSKLFDDGTLLGEITISDYFSGSTNAQWVCLQAPDGVSVRVIVPESAPGVSGAPTVGTVSSPPAPPTPTPWPSVPSGRCTASGNGFLLADYDVQGTQLWLADNTSSSSNLEVCAREQSASGAGEGGTVDASTSSAANQLPQLGVSPDVSPCTVPVNDLNDPLYLHVDASPPNSNQPLPQSLCVSTAPGSGTRLTLAPAPGGGQPVFSSDPGTP
jgi:hypothetical protein